MLFDKQNYFWRVDDNAENITDDNFSNNDDNLINAIEKG